MRYACASYPSVAPIPLDVSRGGCAIAAHCNIFDLRIAIEAIVARLGEERIERRQIAKPEAIQGEFEAKARARDFEALSTIARMLAKNLVATSAAA